MAEQNGVWIPVSETQWKRFCEVIDEFAEGMQAEVIEPGERGDVIINEFIFSVIQTKTRPSCWEADVAQRWLDSHGWS